jgi:hypothetical protein
MLFYTVASGGNVSGFVAVGGVCLAAIFSS